MSGYSLPDLLARVETATGAISLGFTKDGDDDLLIVGGLLGCTNGRDYCTVVDAFRGSLDAALALCERMLPGWTVATISQQDNKTWFAELREGFLTSYQRIEMTRPGLDGRFPGTPAVALLAAMLRALIAQTTSTHPRIEGEGSSIADIARTGPQPRPETGSLPDGKGG